MRKITVVLAICVLLGGCVVDIVPSVAPSPEAPPAESPSPAAQTPSPAAEPSPSPPEPSPTEEPYVLNTDFIIDIELPEPVNYTPEVKVFPLTSTWRKYRFGMEAPVTFVDEQLNRIELPFTPEEYAPVAAWSGSSPKAYALRLPTDHPEYDGRRWVLMLTDGTVPRGEDGEYLYLYNLTHNNHDFQITGNAVFIFERVTGVYYDSQGYETGDDYRFGLYDLEERRVILPCEYENIELGHYDFTARDAMFYVRKDGQGLLLDSKGNTLHHFGEVDSAFFRDAGYGWNSWERIFTYYGRDGELIDGRFMGIDMNDDVLLAYQEKMFAYQGYLYILFDRNGNELMRTEDREEARAAAGIIEQIEVIGDGGSGSYLLDRVGDFLLSYRDAETAVMGINPVSVQTPDGTVLVDNVYGWIDEVLGPGGGLFVYLDPETCVLLMPDGGMTPIPAAPAVETVYYKG